MLEYEWPTVTVPNGVRRTEPLARGEPPLASRTACRMRPKTDRICFETHDGVSKEIMIQDNWREI